MMAAEARGTRRQLLQRHKKILNQQMLSVSCLTTVRGTDLRVNEEPATRTRLKLEDTSESLTQLPQCAPLVRTVRNLF